MLAAIAAALASLVAASVQLPTVALVALTAAGALGGGLVGVLVAALIPARTPQEVTALQALAQGRPLPNLPALRPVHAGPRQGADHAGLEGTLRQELAQAQRRAIEADSRAHTHAQRATQAARVRAAFLTRMSHELRTPLNAVIGYAEMVAEEVDDAELQGDLTRIKRAGLHLKGLVTTVLDLTQLESGRYELRPEPVDVVAMVREVVDGATNEAETQQDTFVLDLPDQAMATVDPRMLQSILFNLIHNAVKYTARGTVTVRVEVDQKLHLIVADTGIGMTPRQLEQAFEAFEQGDGTTTRRYDGSGLGLAICRGFAEAMQGSISIESEVGKGATVTILLPRMVESHVPDDEDADEPTMFVR